MTGEFQHSLDSKGRIFIPSRLREDLGAVFYITISLEESLSAYSKESWQEFSDRAKAVPYSEQSKMRPLFAFAARMEMDTQGRVLIPQNLRAYAGLTKNVTVVGCNDHAEFWDSAVWREKVEVEMTPEYIKAAMKELGL